MKLAKLSALVIGVFACLAIGGVANAAPAELPPGHLTFLGGGWTQPLVRVQMDIPFQNPHSCATTDGYIVDSTLPALQLLTSILLTAYASHQQVRLVVDGCVLGRPNVIGAYLVS
ncbi:MAG: hypothetical protein J7521_14990 [Caulobacter sp.]|nr:hypothetical protein [Caulobacter sp.]